MKFPLHILGLVTTLVIGITISIVVNYYFGETANNILLITAVSGLILIIGYKIWKR